MYAKHDSLGPRCSNGESTRADTTPEIARSTSSRSAKVTEDKIATWLADPANDDLETRIEDEA